jgi:hypothetical protein
VASVGWVTRCASLRGRSLHQHREGAIRQGRHPDGLPALTALTSEGRDRCGLGGHLSRRLELRQRDDHVLPRQHALILARRDARRRSIGLSRALRSLRAYHRLVAEPLVTREVNEEWAASPSRRDVA